jgi:single-strand DNA-binding protein
MARMKKLAQEMAAEQAEGTQDSQERQYRPRTDSNVVMLTGRLGHDPELRYLPSSGVAVAEFRIACGRVVGSGEEAEERTSWFAIKCWNRLAEVCNEHLTAGRRVLVVGRLEEERWQDRETGANRSRVVVTAERVEFLDGPRPEATLEVEQEEVAQAA